MINSLRKDSHITRGFCIPNFTLPPADNTGAGNRNEYRIATENNSVGISVKKPAEINFRGLSSGLLANSKYMKPLVDAAREVEGKGKGKHKLVVNLINGAVEMVQGKEGSEAGGKVKSFVNTHREKLKALLKQAQEMVNDEFKKDPLQGDKFTAKVNETIDNAVDAFPATENAPKLYKKEWFHKFLKMADDNSAVFGALFALILTGIFRPAAIMALPGNKKNADDKKYAAAHSIASGVISYGISLIISQPLSKAIGKIEENKDKYFKGENLKYFESGRVFNASKSYVNILHEAIIAPPRAAITIALIPVILKYLFGWEKKKSNTQIKNPQPLQNNVAKPEIQNKAPEIKLGGQNNANC